MRFSSNDYYQILVFQHPYYVLLPITTELLHHYNKLLLNYYILPQSHCVLLRFYCRNTVHCYLLLSNCIMPSLLPHSSYFKFVNTTNFIFVTVITTFYYINTTLFKLLHWQITPLFLLHITMDYYAGLDPLLHHYYPLLSYYHVLLCIHYCSTYYFIWCFKYYQLLEECNT